MPDSGNVFHALPPQERRGPRQLKWNASSIRFVANRTVAIIVSIANAIPTLNVWKAARRSICALPVQPTLQGIVVTARGTSLEKEPKSV
jgi:hypothetical protein